MEIDFSPYFYRFNLTYILTFIFNVRTNIQKWFSMRILLSLQPICDIKYNNDYHYYIQGFIYNILRDTDYHYVHDKKGNKFFCFSNIFPYNSILRKNRYYYLIISSPDNRLIESIHKNLSKCIGKSVFFGSMKFNIISLKTFSIDILSSKAFKLKTETPIIIRIPSDFIKSEKKYESLLLEKRIFYKLIYFSD